jgi:hypothetical protein
MLRSVRGIGPEAGAGRDLRNPIRAKHLGRLVEPQADSSSAMAAARLSD